MKISEFVEQVLSEITAGVVAAQARDGGENVAAALPAGASLPGNLAVTPLGIFTTVNFEIGLSADSKIEGKAGLKVFSAEAGGGGSHGSQSSHRISFPLPLRIPDGDQTRKLEHEKKHKQESAERAQRTRENIERINRTIF